MAEINVKSPVLKDREIGTYRLVAEVTISGAYCACCGCCSAIDIPGLSINAVCGQTAHYTLCGFEDVSGLAIDTSRDVGVKALSSGSLVGASAAEATAIGNGEAAAVSGSAGSRSITMDLTGGFTNATDTITDAVWEIVIPVKNADF